MAWVDDQASVTWRSIVSKMYDEVLYLLKLFLYHPVSSSETLHLRKWKLLIIVTVCFDTAIKIFDEGVIS